MKSRLKNLALAIMLAAIAAQAGGGDAQALRLKENIQVVDAVITIADLFEDAGRAGDTPILRAPAPGRSGIVPSSQLQNIIRRQGMVWTNPYALKEIFISRQGRLIDNGDIEKAVMARVADILGLDANDTEIDVVFDDTTAALYVPANKKPEIDILHLGINPRNGVFKAVIAAPAGDPKAERRVFSGRAAEVVSLPVPVRAIARGQTIGKDDIEIRKVPRRLARIDAIREESDILGLSARRNLAPGQPLKARDMERPRLVLRNADVTIDFTTTGLRLSGRGKATEEGALGDVIEILNPRSNRSVQAKVVGENRVQAIAMSRSAQLSPAGQ